jgi:hypothetical protein
MRLASVLGAPVVVITGLTVLPTVAAPTASAECVSTAGTMICTQGAGNAGNNGGGDSGPEVPYPCDLDWYCDIGGAWDLGGDDNVSPPKPPGRPDIGLPGRPGNRPNGGGGGSGGGGSSGGGGGGR